MTGFQIVDYVIPGTSKEINKLICEYKNIISLRKVIYSTMRNYRVNYSAKKAIDCIIPGTSIKRIELNTE